MEKENNVPNVIATIIKYGTAIIPYAGGPISCIIGDITQERYIKRLNEYIDTIKTELTDKVEKLDKEKLSSEEFQDIFENNFRSVLRTRTAEKRKLITNLLLNTISYNEITFDDSEYLLYLLDNLTIKHLLCFVFLATIKIPNDHNGVAEKTLDDLCKKNNFKENEALDLIQDLEYQNLIQGFISQYETRGNRGGIVKVGISSYLTEKGWKLYNNIIITK